MTRVEIAAALALLGSDDGQPILRQALSDQKPSVRVVAATRLAEIGDASGYLVVDKVVRDDSTGALAVEALASFYRYEGQTVSVLLDPGSIWIMAPVKIEVVRRLTEILRTAPDPMRRVTAVTVLEKIGGESVLGPLSEALKDSDADVRRMAEGAVRRLREGLGK